MLPERLLAMLGKYLGGQDSNSMAPPKRLVHQSSLDINHGTLTGNIVAEPFNVPLYLV
jgi:hypothetical protein